MFDMNTANTCFLDDLPECFHLLVQIFTLVSKYAQSLSNFFVFFLLHFQPMVNRVSHFIFLEADPTTTSASDPPDLEGQVMAQGERWNILCSWVEDRSLALNRMRLKLEDLKNDVSVFDRWLTSTEEMLRQMERNPSSETEELLRQARCIKVRQV